METKTASVYYNSSTVKKAATKSTVTKKKILPKPKEEEKVLLNDYEISQNQLYTFNFAVNNHLVYHNNFSKDSCLLLNINTGKKISISRVGMTDNCQFAVYRNLVNNIKEIIKDDEFTFEEAFNILMQVYYQESGKNLIYFHLRKADFTKEQLDYLTYDNEHYTVISCTDNIETRASTQIHLLVRYNKAYAERNQVNLKSNDNEIKNKYHLYVVGIRDVFFPSSFNNLLCSISTKFNQIDAVFKSKYFSSKNDYYKLEDLMLDLNKNLTVLNTIKKNFIAEFEEKGRTFDGKKVKVLYDNL